MSAARSGVPAVPTLREVAALAGVSIKTVSRVVNGTGDVAASTASRVEEAIATLGYRPNPFARSLRTGRDDAIGLVVESIGDPFFAEMTEAVAAAASEAGLFLIHAGAGDSAEEELAVVRGLLHRSVRGLVLVPCLLPYGEAGLSVGIGGVPAVFVDRPAAGVRADTVLIDNVRGGYEATAHLLAQGHRRIAFIGTAPERFTLRERLVGYRRALEDAGVAFDPDLVVPHHRTNEARLLEVVLAGEDPATAMLAANAVASIAVVRALHRIGRSEIAFVSFDDFPTADALTPPVTVARQDPGLMGRSATELLLRRIAGEEFPPTEILLPVTLVPRGSGEIAPTRPAGLSACVATAPSPRRAAVRVRTLSPNKKEQEQR